MVSSPVSSRCSYVLPPTSSPSSSAGAEQSKPAATFSSGTHAIDSLPRGCSWRARTRRSRSAVTPGSATRIHERRRRSGRSRSHRTRVTRDRLPAVRALQSVLVRLGGVEPPAAHRAAVRHGYRREAHVLSPQNKRREREPRDAGRAHATMCGQRRGRHHARPLADPVVVAGTHQTTAHARYAPHPRDVLSAGRGRALASYHQLDDHGGGEPNVEAVAHGHVSRYLRQRCALAEREATTTGSSCSV